MIPYRSFWIGEEFVLLYNKFKYIIKREGRSIGEHFREHIEEYVLEHDPGNPQTTIYTYLEDSANTLPAIEGQVRQIFKSRADKGIPVHYKEIQDACRERVETKSAIAMTIRVDKWLRNSMGVSVIR